MCKATDEAGVPVVEANDKAQQQSKLQLRNKSSRIVRHFDPSADKRVGVAGTWYDVSNFADRHPGGNVILEFLGRDATSQFYAMHSPSVIKRFKAVGVYDVDSVPGGSDPLEKEFRAMALDLDARGYFKPATGFYCKKAAACALLLAGSATGAAAGWTLTPAVLLGLFWMQSAFLAHDTLHNQVFKRRRRDGAHGWFWGNVCLGASSHWWKEEHYEHHTFTNAYVEGVGTVDPQQHEAPLWAQDPVLRGTSFPALVAIQHWTFVPILMVFGRFGLMIASLNGIWRRHRSQGLGLVLHWVWVSLLLALVWNHKGRTWGDLVLFYMVAATTQGILALQLCVSHYDKPFAEKEGVKMGWARRQGEVCKDVSCPWWMDWFHGGLNLHRVHHLMPRLSRDKYREVSPMVDAMLQKHGVGLDTEPFSNAVWSTLRHLQAEANRVSYVEVMSGVFAGLG